MSNEGNDPIGRIIRRMVGNFSSDVEIIQAGVIDGRTPDEARTALAAALVYVVEPIDLTPDHYEGLGLIDDAAILRIAAKTALAKGASDEGLQSLAAEVDELALIFGELVVPLHAYFARMMQAPDRRGRTPDEVIADPDARMNMWRDLTKRREGFRADADVAAKMDSEGLVRKLRNHVRDRLVKAGIPL